MFRYYTMVLYDYCRYNLEGQSKRPQAVKGSFRGSQTDNRFKPPTDMKQVGGAG